MFDTFVSFAIIIAVAGLALFIYLAQISIRVAYKIVYVETYHFGGARQRIYHRMSVSRILYFAWLDFIDFAGTSSYLIGAFKVSRDPSKKVRRRYDFD